MFYQLLSKAIFCNGTAIKSNENGNYMEYNESKKLIMIRNALLKFAYNKKLRIMGQIIKKGKKVSLHRNDNRRSNQKGWENMETAKYAKIWEEDVEIPTYEMRAVSRTFSSAVSCGQSRSS